MKYQILNKIDNSLYPCTNRIDKKLKVGEYIFITTYDSYTFDPQWTKFTHIGEGILTIS